jgi:hypothetical protein
VHSRQPTMLSLSAHSETVGAGAKMPARQQRQVSTKVVTRAGYDCSTPEAVTQSRLLVRWTSRRVAGGPVRECLWAKALAAKRLLAHGASRISKRWHPTTGVAVVAARAGAAEASRPSDCARAARPQRPRDRGGWRYCLIRRSPARLCKQHKPRPSFAAASRRVESLPLRS